MAILDDLVAPSVVTSNISMPQLVLRKQTESVGRWRATGAKIRAIKIAGWVLLGSLVAIYTGGLLLGVTAAITVTLVRLLEFIGVIIIPVAGGAFLLWFAYKLFLEPVMRQRRLDRLREYRARRDANLTTDSTDKSDSH